MKVQNLIYLFLFILMGMGCNTAHFDRVPGNYLDLIPTEIHGTYTFQGKDFRSRKTDTLEIQVGINEIKFNTPAESEIWRIHQNFQLHRMGTHFILAKNDAVIKSLWNLYVIEQTANGLKVYPIRDDFSNNGTESKMQQYFPIRDLLITHEPVVNPPSPLDGAIVQPTETGTGAESVRYYVINDEQFQLFFDKELKDKEFVLLKKIQVEKKEPKPKKSKK